LATAPLPASARAGELDPSFGTGGTVNITSGTDVPDLLVQKPLKKYLVLLGDYVTQSRFGVMRLNLNGSLDTTFGTEGVVRVGFGRRIRLLPQGAFLVVGTVSQGSGATQKDGIGLARFLADGRPDPAFGTGGVSLTFFNGGHHNGVDAVVQADGNIVVMDAHPFGDLKPGNFRLVRFTAAGSLDPSYGTGGRVAIDFGGDEHEAAAVLQPDGNVVVVGDTDALAPGTARDVAAARFRPDGTLDPSFGQGGKVIARFGNSYASIRAVARQADGHLLLSGSDGYGKAVVVRMTVAGQIATGFGNQGIVVFDPTPQDDDYFLRVGVTGSDQVMLLLLAGTGPFRDGVVRLDGVTGAFDPTFGYGGAVIKSGGPPESMIVHGNGKVVTGTFTPGTTAPVPAVQRYLGS
jgi:uncharacterized delta-60 repeat protein